MKKNTKTDESVQQREGNDEHVEMAIITQSNAIAQPRTMMVKIQHTIVTNGTMTENW